MPKTLLLITTLIVILLTAFLTLYLNNREQKSSVSKNEIDTAVNQAKFLYQQKKARNEDFSDGPCLSNSVIPNWVADIVHNPRTTADNLSQNQCPAYLEGRARHFVELDLDGNLVRAI